MRMTFRVLLMLVALWMSTQTSSHAQERGQAAARPGRPAPPNMHGDFTFIPSADLEALMGPTRGDRPARVVNIGNANLGAYILHYPEMKTTLPANSFYHAEISELYYVIRGEGTALLGGELENPRWNDPNSTTTREITGPTVSGTMKGYRTQKWSAGDVIIVPAGVPHMIGFEVAVPNDILRIAFDPNKALKLVPNHDASIARLRAEGQTQGQTQAAAAPGKPAPSNMPGTFTFLPKADLEALMKGNIADTPARVVNIPNNSNFGAFVLHIDSRKPTPGAPVTSFYHSEISEVYYVVRGAGTVLIGGELENATWDDSNSASIRQVRGPSVNGTMKNPQSVKFTAGDIFIVPAGVPHSFTYEITERTDIVRAVVDPRRSLELK